MCGAAGDVCPQSLEYLGRSGAQTRRQGSHATHSIAMHTHTLGLQFVDYMVYWHLSSSMYAVGYISLGVTVVLCSDGGLLGVVRRMPWTRCAWIE